MPTLGAAEALQAAELQRAALAAGNDRGIAVATARSESAAELLCGRAGGRGLPVDRAAAERLLGDVVGPAAARTPATRPSTGPRRDDAVLRHAPAGAGVDLRNPARCATLLGRVGIDVPDTRSWRLEPFRGTHPLVGGAARLAQGRADRDDLRLRLAGPRRRAGRPAARRAGPAATARPAG